VADGREELALIADDPLDAAGHAIERPGDLGHFAGDPPARLVTDRRARRKLAGAEALGGAGHLLERAGELAGDAHRRHRQTRSATPSAARDATDAERTACRSRTRRRPPSVPSRTIGM